MIRSTLDPMTVIPSQSRRWVSSIGIAYATNQENDDDTDEVHWP